MATLTHWKKLDNPDYIGAYAFQPGEKKALTIKVVRREMVHGVDGKKEECTLVYFKENEKPLILNATNGKTISKVIGTAYIEEWADHMIVLGVEKVKAFGEVVEAVRVKNEKPTVATPATIPPCADCGKAITDNRGFQAARIVKAGVQKYGVALCMDCVDKRGIAAKENPTEEGAMNDENDQN